MRGDVDVFYGAFLKFPNDELVNVLAEPEDLRPAPRRPQLQTFDTNFFPCANSYSLIL